MNGAATTNKGVITVVTTSIAILAAAGVATICLMSFYGIQIPPELNTLTAGLVGYLGAMLVKTSPTETQTQPPHPTPPRTITFPDANVPPTEVKIVNKPIDPVPITDEGK